MDEEKVSNQSGKPFKKHGYRPHYKKSNHKNFKKPEDNSGNAGEFSGNINNTDIPIDNQSPAEKTDEISENVERNVKEGQVQHSGSKPFRSNQHQQPHNQNSHNQKHYPKKDRTDFPKEDTVSKAENIQSDVKTELIMQNRDITFNKDGSLTLTAGKSELEKAVENDISYYDDPPVFTNSLADELKKEAQSKTLAKSVGEDENSVTIIGVRFKKSSKIYYFDPNGIECSAGDNVIVETARGIEYGYVALGNRPVQSSSVVPPLRPLIRKATSEDTERNAQNELKEIEAFNICVDRIAQHNLDMKLIEAEYTFDNSKLLFYFSHDGRVDFRDLVKDLASVFRTRIELRQVGIRDEAKIMGGLGICGRAYCCHAYLNDYLQVSMKMAKEQNISMNAQKLSGACGKLLCCLKYEYDNYAQELAKLPPVDSIVMTPDGEGLVTEVSPLLQSCKVRLTADMTFKVYPGEVITVKGHFVRDNSPESGATFDVSEQKPKNNM